MATAEKLCVIGDGGMGTICAIMLAENGHDVVLWSAFADQAGRSRPIGRTSGSCRARSCRTACG